MYLAPTRVNLQLTLERWPGISFLENSRASRHCRLRAFDECPAPPATIVSWAFYDWANSSFATTVMAGFFPVFFKQYWSRRNRSDCQHVSSWHGQRCRGVPDRADGAAARRDCRPRGARVKLLLFFTLAGCRS